MTKTSTWVAYFFSELKYCCLREFLIKKLAYAFYWKIVLLSALINNKLHDFLMMMMMMMIAQNHTEFFWQLNAKSSNWKFFQVRLRGQSGENYCERRWMILSSCSFSFCILFLHWSLFYWLIKENSYDFLILGLD